MPVYDATPAGDVRRGLADGSFAVTGDPVKMVTAMIDCADAASPPKRLLLGSGAYDRVHAALTARLEELGTNKAITRSTEIDA